MKSGCGAAPGRGVITVEQPSGSIKAAAAHDTYLAAACSKGIRAWDLRFCNSSGNASSSTNNSSNSNSSRSGLLFVRRMPDSAQPVCQLHLDRVKLVAASSAALLHSPGGIAVWSMPGGKLLQQLSST